MFSKKFGMKDAAIGAAITLGLCVVLPAPYNPCDFLLTQWAKITGKKVVS